LDESSGEEEDITELSEKAPTADAQRGIVQLKTM
jgi:hypothetical protein